MEKGNGSTKAKVLAAELTGVSLCSVRKICHEIEVGGVLTSNKKVIIRKDMIDHLKDYEKEDIDIAIHEEFRLVATEKERPYISVRNLHRKLMQVPDFPRMCPDTLRKVIHSLGYRFQPTQTDRNVLLIDTPDLIEKRKRCVCLHKKGGHKPHLYFFFVQTDCNQTLHVDTLYKHVYSELYAFLKPPVIPDSCP